MRWHTNLENRFRSVWERFLLFYRTVKEDTRAVRSKESVLITEVSLSDDWWLHFIQKQKLLKISQQWVYQLMRWCTNLESVLITEVSSLDDWWLCFIQKQRLLKVSQQQIYQLMRWHTNLESRFKSVQERNFYFFYLNTNYSLFSFIVHMITYSEHHAETQMKFECHQQLWRLSVCECWDCRDKEKLSYILSQDNEISDIAVYVLNFLLCCCW